jgi:3'-phosphoadenosine 5'-phosphosulfate sulfotransferase (PAPS reductase)/FAD synthetase
MSDDHLATILFPPDPPRTPDELAYQARLILSAAIEEWNPVAIYIALSGGNDSRTVAHVALPVLANDPRFRGALLVDTGVAVPETHESLREFVSVAGVTLTVQRTPEEYEGIVLLHGFPGPPQHPRMYQRLKERALRLVTAREKEGLHPHSRIMLVSGVRKYESKKRVLLSQPVTKDGGRVWVNPLFWWTTPERNAYMQARNIVRNPVSEVLCGSSGDCLCGSMADPDGEAEMGALEIHFPSSYRMLRRLEEKARAAGVWAHWGIKQPGQKRSKRGSEDAIASHMFMCVGCELRHAAKVLP